MSKDNPLPIYPTHDENLYKLSYKYVENPSEWMKQETITLKNLFTAFAADIEKVANEALGPSTDTRICIPPEIIDYWLLHIEMILEIDTLSLLGKEKENAVQPR